MGCGGDVGCRHPLLGASPYPLACPCSGDPPGTLLCPPCCPRAGSVPREPWFLTRASCHGSLRPQHPPRCSALPSGCSQPCAFRPFSLRPLGPPSSSSPPARPRSPRSEARSRSPNFPAGFHGNCPFPSRSKPARGGSPSLARGEGQAGSGLGGTPVLIQQRAETSPGGAGWSCPHPEHPWGPWGPGTIPWPLVSFITSCWRGDGSPGGPQLAP